MMQQHSDTPVSKLRLAPWLSAFALVAGVGTLACLAGSWVQPSLDTSNVRLQLRNRADPEPTALIAG